MRHKLRRKEKEGRGVEREFKREPKIRGSQTSLYSRFYFLGTRRLRNGVKEKKEKEGLWGVGL